MAEDKSTPGGANKYSVYAQRSVDSTQINWNEISGQLVKGLETIRDERQSRKDAIEKSTQDAIEQLSQVPETGTQDAASLLINGSAMSIKSVQEQNDLMKRGLISPKDNMLFMQQQKNGYKSLSTAVKGWDAWAVEARTRLEDPNISSGNLETFTNLQTEALGNLKNKKLWTNPTNGKMQLVTMGYNKTTKLYDVMPDYETRKQDYQNPNTMLNFMKFQNAGVDVNELAKKQTANIAQIVTANRERLTALGGGGGINSFDDFRQLGEFGKDENGGAITYDMWKTDNIDAMVGDITDTSNLNAAEMLTNAGYAFAQTESQFLAENKGKDISKWIKVDMSTGQPVPEMNEAQMKQARRLADVAIEAQVSHIVKMTEGKGAKEAQLPNNAAIAQSKLDRSMVGYMDDANALASDDESTFDATAQDRIVALNKEMTAAGGDPNKMIDSITRDDTTITFTLADGTPETIPRLDDNGVPRNSEDIVREVYRLITPQTDDYQNSYKAASILYKKEPDGGFRATDRDMNDVELIAAAKEKRGIEKLKTQGINQEIAETNAQGNPTGKMIENPAYEPALAQAILDDTDNITADEKAAVKKRILKNITGQKYRALAPLPLLKQNTAKIGTKVNADGDLIGATGTELIEEKVGDKLSGLDASSIGDDPVEVNDVLSQVMNDYLPDGIKGGAKVMFKKDDVDDDKWVIEVSYFDRKGIQQTLSPIYPEVGAMMNFKGATPSQLNEMMHEAAKKVIDEENARLTTRNLQGTGKKRRQLN